MKIDDTTPEKIMKDLESVQMVERKKRSDAGQWTSVIIVISLAIWWMTDSASLKEIGITAYHFIDNIIHIVQA